ncbi:MAG TPA: ParB/RepB/Spo0J family partition protein [Verrucomicrobiota bacterium]|nr:ParB/RepB/Spo0J family partition protein [Verrucomicrobiota bacterium]HNU49338.1 ParB/RepB/Spo0J family partition protein [Verrucomicrobiota bacterium]
MAKPALGRGLGALLGTPSSPTPPPASAAPKSASLAAEPTAAGTERVERVALSRLRPCPLQPRKDFPGDALQELADSIREQGIVQPLIVRRRGDAFELIAGERRWRAAQLAGLTEVPVLVREADDTAALELALIENLQRENLNPVEEAQGYQQLIDQFHLRQEDVAARVGKSRVAVANTLRLLRLPEEVLGHLRQGRLSVGHAKVLLALPTPEEQRLAGDRVLRDGLNVRQTEELVARLQQSDAAATPRTARTRAGASDVHLAALETRLRERLGTKVRLRYHQGKGALEIRFFDDRDFERILQLLGVSPD